MDRMGLILEIEGLGTYEATVKSVKLANDQVASSMQTVEVKSKSSGKSILDLAAGMALGSSAAAALQKGLQALKAGLKALLVDTTMATARYKVLDAALDASATQAGHTKKEIDELQMAIHRKGVTYQAATQLALQLLDAEMDLEGALDLVTTAQNAASRAGVSTSDTIQRILWSVQTAQPELLRAVYLTVDYTKAEEELAKTLKKSRDVLSDKEKMQARANAVVKAGVPLAGSYDAAMGEGLKTLGSMRDRLKDVNVVLGEVTYPAWNVIVQEAYGTVKSFLTYLEDHKDELQEFGEALADGISEAIDVIDTLITRLDEMVKEAEDAGDKIGGALVTAGTHLAGLIIGFEEAQERSKKLGEYGYQALSLLAGGAALAAEAIKQAVVEMEELFQSIHPAGLAARFLKGEMAEIGEGFRFEFDTSKMMKAFDDATVKVGELTGLIEKADEKPIEDVAKALDQVGEEAEEATKEQTKAAEALAGLRLDLQRDLADRLIEIERETLREEIGLAREREDAARKAAADVAKAYENAEEERAALTVDAAKERTEFERDALAEWNDLERDAARERESLDRDYAERKVDVETDTRRRLQEIQRQFNQSVQDASRTRDAFALVQATRRAQQERDDAARDRNEQLDDARIAYRRQVDEHRISLAEQREDLKRSLGEQRADLVADLAERQQAVETQLQEQLASIQEAQRQEIETKALQLEREREDATLQAQWEQEDRTRRLARQLEDMRTQYGDIGDVTAKGLQEQIAEWAKTYGREGAATKIAVDYRTIVESQLQAIVEAQKAATLAIQEEAEKQQAAIGETARRLSEADKELAKKRLTKYELRYEAPPELQLHSPKLGIQLGLEKLHEMLTRQAMPSFMAGGFPAPVSKSSATMPSRVAHDHGGRIGVDVNTPSNLDLVVQRQLVQALRGALKGAK